MPVNTHLFALLLAPTALVMIAPGPDMLFVLGCGMRGGPRAGLLALIFTLRIAGWGARRIAGIDAEGVPCPSAHDPWRNRHRSGAGWSVGTVLSILANPRYTG